MKRRDVQDFAAARIAAVPALAAFGAAFKHSAFVDVDAVRTAQGDKLRTVGVVFEISPVAARRVENRESRGVNGNCSLFVLVAENPKIAHSPSRDDLVDEVIEAITTESRLQWEETDVGINEEGYVLHVISFSGRVTIP